MLHRIHLEVGVVLLPDIVVDLSEQPLLPQKVAVQNPESQDGKDKGQDDGWVLQVVAGKEDHRGHNEGHAPTFELKGVSAQAVDDGLGHLQVFDDFLHAIQQRSLLHRDDIQLSQTFKVPAVIGEQNEAVVHRRSAYQEVEVTDEHPSGSQSASFLSKYPANSVV